MAAITTAPSAVVVVVVAPSAVVAEGEVDGAALPRPVRATTPPRPDVAVVAEEEEEEEKELDVVITEESIITTTAVPATAMEVEAEADGGTRHTRRNGTPVFCNYFTSLGLYR